MTRAALATATLLAALAAPALRAADVTECDSRSSAWNLAEPWEEMSRTFSNGKVRVAMIDTIEPAGAPFYLLVLSPPFDPLGARQCRLVEAAPGMGFYAMKFHEMTSTYHPTTGLRLTLPVSVWSADKGETEPRKLSIGINQETGAIDASVE